MAVTVAFLLNGRPLRLLVGEDRRLLDVLREDLHLTGAKEGCGKGECGACTVLVDGQAVDSCLTMAFQVDGCAVETIEGLGTRESLHPIQDAFIETGGVQCGICIPGMVLAARALLARTPAPDASAVRHGLAGNLCRCTGYTKIVEAVLRAAGQTRPEEPVAPPAPCVPSFFRPRSLEEALEVLAARAGQVTPLAGGTDALVKAKDGALDRATLFDVTRIPELGGIREEGSDLWIGAAATHTEMMGSPLVARYAPALPAACAVIGGPQIRNRGTLGGNLANASPAADTVPALYAADAVVELASISERRSIPIGRFFLGPRRTVLERDELILGVRVPRRPGVRGTFLRLGQRQAQAISKVSVAVAMAWTDGQPSFVRVALGAVAPTVVRAPRTEAALAAGDLARAQAEVQDEIRPIDDIRSTAAYRREMAAVLLGRAVRILELA